MQYIVGAIIVSLFLSATPKTPAPVVEGATQPEVIEVPAEPSSTQSDVEVTVTRPTEPEPSIEDRIRSVFGKDARTALAVFTVESGLKADSKGWNCRYEGKSMACKKADRHLAWSVDCGVAQINVKGKECPAELLEPQHNIEHAKGMFDRRGWQPWVAYNSGKYKEHLAKY